MIDGHAWQDIFDVFVRGAGGDALAIERLSSDFPTSIVFNPGRSALQLKSCDGESMVGHIPLSPAQVAMVSRSLRPKVLAMR
jgi:hypothetical protein